MYAAAAADVLGVRNLYLQNRVEENAQEVKKRAEPKPDTRPQEENWINPLYFAIDTVARREYRLRRPRQSGQL